MDAKLQQLAMIASGIGVFLIVLSILVNYQLIPLGSINQDEWSSEDATAFEQSAMAFHNASFDKKISEEELQETEDEFEANREKLDTILNRGKSLPKYLQFVGFGFVGLGIVFYVVALARNPD